MHLVLASGSPRRRVFLENMGLSFEIDTPEVDESPLAAEAPDVYVQRMAQTKARAVAAKHAHAVVLAADTIVVLGSTIIGKPANREAAKATMRLLSGKTHQVMTAVCICQDEHIEAFMETTEVTFAPLSEELIETYVASGECDDKSGAYAVQGIGAMLIQKIKGSVSSVVGLPVYQVRQHLEKFGIKPHTVQA